MFVDIEIVFLLQSINGHTSNNFPLKKRTSFQIHDHIKPIFFLKKLSIDVFVVIIFVWLEKYFIFFMHMKFNVFLNHQKNKLFIFLELERTKKKRLHLLQGLLKCRSKRKKKNRNEMALEITKYLLKPENSQHIFGLVQFNSFRIFG